MLGPLISRAAFGSPKCCWSTNLRVFGRRIINMVFEILRDLQYTERKAVVMVDQNTRKGLEFADLGIWFRGS